MKSLTAVVAPVFTDEGEYVAKGICEAGQAQYILVRIQTISAVGQGQCILVERINSTVATREASMF